MLLSLEFKLQVPLANDRSTVTIVTYVKKSNNSTPAAILVLFPVPMQSQLSLPWLRLPAYLVLQECSLSLCCEAPPLYALLSASPHLSAGYNSADVLLHPVPHPMLKTHSESHAGEAVRCNCRRHLLTKLPILLQGLDSF